MSTDIIHRAFQALASNDADRIAAVFTADAEWRSPPGNATAVALGTTSHMIGRDAIAHFFAEEFPRLFPRDVALTFHRMHTERQWGVAEATMTATMANGYHYTNEYCFVFELRDGLIRRASEYADTARGHQMVFGRATQPSLATSQ